MFEKFDAIFFDIDGTLVNLFSVHIQSYRDTFKKITGIDESNPRFFSDLFKLGTDKAVWKRALELKGQKPTDSLVQKLVHARPSEFERLILRVSKAGVLPGVLTALKYLKKSGKRLFVFSGNTRKLSEMILSKTELAVFFERGFFSSDSSAIKNKESLFRFALQKSKIPKNLALAVGDTPNDVLAAQKLGMGALAVATGYHSVRELKAIRYGRVISRLPSKIVKIRPRNKK
ncbi:MAG: HAD family hydrolase [Candidatus Micrarchaeota archaeon]